MTYSIPKFNVYYTMKFYRFFLLTFIVTLVMELIILIVFIIIDTPKVLYSKCDVVQRLIFFEHNIVATSFSSNEDNYLVYCSQRYSEPIIYDDIYIFDLHNSKHYKIQFKSFFKDFIDCEFYVNACSPSPSGKLIAFIVNNGKKVFLLITKFKKENHSLFLIRKLEIDNTDNSIYWTNDEKMCILFSNNMSSEILHYNNRISLYDCEKNIIISSLTLGKSVVIRDITIQDTETILIICQTGQIISWSPRFLKREMTKKVKISGEITFAKFSKDGSRVAVCISNGFFRNDLPNIRFQVHDLKNNKIMYDKSIPEYITDISWSPDSSRLVITDELTISIINCNPFLFYCTNIVTVYENNINNDKIKNDFLSQGIPISSQMSYMIDHFMRVTNNYKIHLYDNHNGYITYYNNKRPLHLMSVDNESSRFFDDITNDGITNIDKNYGEFILLKMEVQ